MTERDHGYARYKLDNCRCYICGYANATYCAARERAIAYGTWRPFVDAAPVREHLLRLRECGVGLRRIAEVAGVDRKRLQAILAGRSERGTGPQEKVRPQLAQAVLAVEPSLDLLASKTAIDSSGSRRRLQALVAMGWSQAKLAERLGWTPANFWRLMNSARVTVATVRAVRALYDTLWNQAPPEEGQHDKIAASRARNHAQANGWQPPLAWDDDLFDVPDADLEAALNRLVDRMDDDDLVRAHRAYYSYGDRSPLVVAAKKRYAQLYSEKRRADRRDVTA